MKNILNQFTLVSISVFFIVTNAFGDVLSGGKKIRILGIGDPVFQVMQKILPEMEKAAGGTIELDVRGFDPLRQQVLLNSKNKESDYDLIAVDLPQFGEYTPFLSDMSDYVDGSTMDPSDFYQVAWAGGIHDGGKILGIPLQPHPEIFAYRKDIFAKYGLAAPKSTDDVINAAKIIHENEEGMAGICWNAGRGTPLGQAFIMTQGAFGQASIDLDRSGDGFTFATIADSNMRPMVDTPSGRATAQYFLDLMKYSPDGILNMAWDERVRVFSQGGCGMTYIWSGRSAIYENDPDSKARGKVGYLPHPHGPGAYNMSTLGGWYLSIPKNIDPERADLAWSVIEWLTSKDMLQEYTKHGNCVSPRPDVSQEPSVQKQCPVIGWVDAMAQFDLLAGWQRPPVPEIQGIVDTMGVEMHDMISGGKSLDDAIKTSQKKLERMMKKAGYSF